MLSNVNLILMLFQWLSGFLHEFNSHAISMDAISMAKGLPNYWQCSNSGRPGMVHVVDSKNAYAIRKAWDTPHRSWGSECRECLALSDKKKSKANTGHVHNINPFAV